MPPNPKGWTPAAAHQPLGPTSGRPCRRSPGLFVLSPSHSVDRAAWVVSPLRRASPALLNVSAADEFATLDGGAKASSQRTSTEVQAPSWGAREGCITRRRSYQPYQTSALLTSCNTRRRCQGSPLGELRRRLNPLARGLERLLSPAGDRFETASSKFHWNPSPLLPLMHAGKNGARKPCTANSALGVARSVVFGFARCKRSPKNRTVGQS